MSTVGPQAIARLSERMPSHASLLDVPVLGSLPEAEAGELRLFAGGEDAPLERALPLLRVLGEPLHVGGPGSGAAAKLVANATLVGTIALLGETLALADGLGLPRETVFDVLSVTPLAAQAERRRPAIEAIGAGRYTALIFSRAIAFFAFGAIGGLANQQLKGSLTKLDLYDQIDDDTGLFNARYFLQDTDLEVSRSRRYQTIFSVTVVDVPSEAEKKKHRHGRPRKTGRPGA